MTVPVEDNFDFVVVGGLFLFLFPLYGLPSDKK